MSRDVDHEREAIDWAKRAEDAYRGGLVAGADAAARLSLAHSAILANERQA